MLVTRNGIIFMNEETQKELVKQLARPVYEDALKPFSKEIAHGLVSVARSINAGMFLMEDCVVATTNVLRMTAEKLALLPPSELSFTNSRVALQALDQSKFAVNQTEIQELFANLIATSLTLETSELAHPAFIEIIKQLQSDEALIIKYISQEKTYFGTKVPVMDIHTEFSFENAIIKSTSPSINLVAEDAGCKNPEQSDMYFVNLIRLGLVTKGNNQRFPDIEYERILQSQKVKDICKASEDMEFVSVSGDKKSYHLTQFGYQFANAAIQI